MIRPVAGNVYMYNHFADIVNLLIWHSVFTSPRSGNHIAPHSHDDVIKCKHFRVTGPMAENSPVTGEFSAQRSVPRSFDVIFDLRLNKQLNKRSWGWCFEMPSRSLWRHYNGMKHDQSGLHTQHIITYLWSWFFDVVQGKLRKKRSFVAVLVMKI